MRPRLIHQCNRCFGHTSMLMVYIRPHCFCKQTLRMYTFYVLKKKEMFSIFDRLEWNCQNAIVKAFNYCRSYDHLFCLKIVRLTTTLCNGTCMYHLIYNLLHNEMANQLQLRSCSLDRMCSQYFCTKNHF